MLGKQIVVDYQYLDLDYVVKQPATGTSSPPSERTAKSTDREAFSLFGRVSAGDTTRKLLSSSFEMLAAVVVSIKLLADELVWLPNVQTAELLRGI